LEDIAVGDKVEFGHYEVTAEEIIDYARRFDPQPIHLDDDAARAAGLGGLIASGWHSVGMYMRMLVDNVLVGGNSMPSPGADEVRWLKPVRPGDVLSIRGEALEARPSRSKPDRGIVRWRYEMINQNDETVMSLVGIGFVQRRPQSSIM
jgi:acyl dehydratase